MTDTSNIQELESDIATLKIQINNIKNDIGTLNEGEPDLQTQINNKLQGGSGPVEPGETQSQCTCGADIAALKVAIDGTAADETLSYNPTDKGGTIDARLTELEGKPGCNCAGEISEIKGIIGGTTTGGVTSYTIETEGGTLDARLEALETKVGDPINKDGSNNIIPLQDQIGHPATTIDGTTQEATGIYKLIDDNKCTCIGGGSSNITCATMKSLVETEKNPEHNNTTNSHCKNICDSFKNLILQEQECTNICDAIGQLIQNERKQDHPTKDSAPHCTNICNALRLLIENESTCDNMCNAIKNLIIHEKDHKSDGTHCTNICDAIKQLVNSEQEKSCQNLNTAIQILINNDNGNIDSAIAGLIQKENSNIKNAIKSLLQTDEIKQIIRSIVNNS